MCCTLMADRTGGMWYSRFWIACPIADIQKQTDQSNSLHSVMFWYSLHLIGQFRFSFFHDGKATWNRLYTQSHRCIVITSIRQNQSNNWLCTVDKGLCGRNLPSVIDWWLLCMYMLIKINSLGGMWFRRLCGEPAVRWGYAELAQDCVVLAYHPLAQACQLCKVSTHRCDMY